MNNSKNKTVETKNPIEQILDENNRENVILFDDEGNKIELEQVAVIPLERTNKTYVILLPITPMKGVEDGEGVLFELDEKNQKLNVITDDTVIDEVLVIYETLIDDEDDSEK